MGRCLERRRRRFWGFEKCLLDACAPEINHRFAFCLLVRKSERKTFANKVRNSGEGLQDPQSIADPLDPSQSQPHCSSFLALRPADSLGY